jgi:hypothetical protein
MPMVEMQQAAPPAPASPSTPGAAGQTTTLPAQAPTGLLDLSKYTRRQLERMLADLSSQRADFARRRETTSGSYENATGVNREGLGERLKTLDANIMRYENEMTRVGREIATRPITEQTTSTGDPGPGWVRAGDAAGTAFGFSFGTMLLTFFFVRGFLRRKYAGGGGINTLGRQQQPNLIASNERLERIEQAVDSIAIEVERVSENQRFMTRLMTETQLGETLKDVRKSADLAKSAASDSP